MGNSEDLAPYLKPDAGVQILNGLAVAPIDFKDAHTRVNAVYFDNHASWAWRNRDVEALSETDARCGHRHDDVVQQQVFCGSQYYDGYRTRTAPRC